jgi:hypothetical protein
MRLAPVPATEKVTYEIWRTHRTGADDTQVAGNMTARQARAYLKECRAYPVVGVEFYRVRATVRRERVMD